MLSLLSAALRRKRNSSNSPRCRRSFGLSGEELETRELPAATYVWRPPAGTDHLWSTAGNWLVDSNRPLIGPQAEDTVVFDEQSIGTAEANIPKIRYLEIRTGANGAFVQLNNQLEVTHSFIMKSNGLVKSRIPGAIETLALTESCSCTWDKGTLRDINLSSVVVRTITSKDTLQEM